MVFCYQNCSDQLWEKIVPVIEKNFWNSRLKAENFWISKVILKRQKTTSSKHMTWSWPLKVMMNGNPISKETWMKLKKSWSLAKTNMYIPYYFHTFPMEKCTSFLKLFEKVNQLLDLSLFNLHCRCNFLIRYTCKCMDNLL